MILPHMVTAKYERALRLKLARNFMYLIALEVMQRGEDLSGYDLHKLVNERFKIFISSATAYQVMEFMKQKGFVAGRLVQHVTRYQITESGTEYAEAIFDTKDQTLRMLLMALKIGGLNE